MHLIISNNDTYVLGMGSEIFQRYTAFINELGLGMLPRKLLIL